MERRRRPRRLEVFAVVLFLAVACSPPERSGDPTRQIARETRVETVRLPPVTFEPRYEPFRDSGLGEDLRSRIAVELREKGYRVLLRPGDEPSAGETADAILDVRVDFLFISETYSERQPPPVIDIEASARLTGMDGRELWSGRGSSRAGGAGGGEIFRPELEKMVVLEGLAENLLDSLPGNPPTAD